MRASAGSPVKPASNDVFTLDEAAGDITDSVRPTKMSKLDLRYSSRTVKLHGGGLRTLASPKMIRRLDSALHWGRWKCVKSPLEM